MTGQNTEAVQCCIQLMLVCASLSGFLSETYCSNEELFEGLLLHGEGDVSDAEASERDTKIGAAQLGVLLLSRTLALGPVSHRQAIPGC